MTNVEHKMTKLVPTSELDIRRSKFLIQIKVTWQIKYSNQIFFCEDIDMEL